MVIQILISLVVLVIVFCSASLCMLVGRILRQHLLTDETRSVVTGSMGVVGTLTALVLGLLIAGASSSYYTKNQEVVLIAADVIRLDRLLRRYGPEAEGLRDLLGSVATLQSSGDRLAGFSSWHLPFLVYSNGGNLSRMPSFVRRGGF